MKWEGKDSIRAAISKEAVTVTNVGDDRVLHRIDTVEVARSG